MSFALRRFPLAIGLNEPQFPEPEHACWRLFRKGLEQLINNRAPRLNEVIVPLPSVVVVAVVQWTENLSLRQDRHVCQSRQ